MKTAFSQEIETDARRGDRHAALAVSLWKLYRQAPSPELLDEYEKSLNAYRQYKVIAQAHESARRRHITHRIRPTPVR